MPRERLVEIDVGRAASVADLHRKLQEALHFPKWYGCNWDAFWDSITCLVEMPEALKLVGWTTLVGRLPRDAEQLRRALDEMATEYPKEAPHVLYA